MKLMKPAKAAKYAIEMLEYLNGLKAIDQIAILTVSLHMVLRASLSDRAKIKALSLQLHEAIMETMDAEDEADDRVVPFKRKRS